MTNASYTRRRLLACVGLTLSTVVTAGCSGSGSQGGSTSTPSADETAASADESGPSTPTATSTPTNDGSSAPVSPTRDTATSAEDEPTSMSGPSTPTAAPDELDLREANVVDVVVEQSGSGYRFDVTLYHDDDGESGYANWWQVETLSGERLGRRELLHAHSTAPFTRSTTVSVPEGVTYVVVRGHDQTHGYGGQAMVVNVDSGETQAVRQGSEPREFTGFEPSV